MSKEIFNLGGKIILDKKNNERFLSFSSKELVNFFILMGFKPGNKIKNQPTIPDWIFRNNSFLKSCLRGLIDTDGCIHKMSKKDPKLIRINFKNNNLRLLNSAREGFIKLGYNPSNITNDVFYLSRQKEIHKYLKEINFSNKKHLDRLKNFKSPVF